MCQESILQVIRENMPVEKILRAYIDSINEDISPTPKQIKIFIE